MMLPEAWVVIVSEPPDDDDEAAAMLSAAATATGAAVGAGAGDDVGLPGLTEGEGVGRGVGAKTPSSRRRVDGTSRKILISTQRCTYKINSRPPAISYLRRRPRPRRPPR